MVGTGTPLPSLPLLGMSVSALTHSSLPGWRQNGGRQVQQLLPKEPSQQKAGVGGMGTGRQAHLLLSVPEQGPAKWSCLRSFPLQACPTAGSPINLCLSVQPAQHQSSSSNAPLIHCPPWMAGPTQPLFQNQGCWSPTAGISWGRRNIGRDCAWPATCAARGRLIAGAQDWPGIQL